MREELKKMLAENSLLAVIFGIIGGIWLLPIISLYVTTNIFIAKPIKYLFGKFKTNRPFKK